MLRVLDLFSGIGGFSLGLERAGMETVAFCEFDKKAQLVLKKHWPDVPIYDDVRKLNGKQFEGQAIDLICGGFPCQPFSVAGKQRGKEDDRHLWPEYFRLIQSIRPRWVLCENVAGLINLGLDQVLSDLESENYTVQTFNIPACAVNAPHRRDRLWIVANSRHGAGRDGERGIIRGDGRGEFQEKIRMPETIEAAGSGETPEVVAHAKSLGVQGGGAIGGQESQTHGETELSLCGGAREGTSNWDVEPDVGRVANGVPRRVDRLKQLGNAVVPQVVEQIGRAIMEVDSNTFFGD